VKKPKLGQNFLIDEHACLHIADALGDISQRTVIEIGPGHGAITDLLAPRSARLHCIEFDPTLARELTFRFRNTPTVTIHQADILTTDLSPFSHLQSPQLDIVGNLPYYITSDILLHLFTFARQTLPSGEPLLHRAVLMMQREVADRIAALPGSSDYGPLSALTQLHGSVTNLFTLPPSAFNPPPDVHSTVVRLEFAPRFAELGLALDTPNTPGDFAPFNRFLRASFAQKRKTLANNLRSTGYTAAQLAAAWPPSIPPQARSEAVPLDAMALLYRTLFSRTDDLLT
jgi:16S rRNA (adenine1518-N6/adenine1519-N6)-dimethyltransferase